jgi:hypothetical protein
MSVLPGWDSVDSTATVAHTLHVTAIVVLGLLFLSEGLALIYDSRKDHLTAVADRDRTVEQQRKEDATETRRKAEVEGLQKQLYEADKKVTDLQSQQIARRLSPEQKAMLVAALMPFAKQKVLIWCSTNAWDCTNFATDFQSVFKQANWDVPETIVFGIAVGYDSVGIEVLANPQWISDPAKIPQSIVVLITTLMNLGLMSAPNLGRLPEAQPETIFFRIGRIPPK